MNHCPCPQCHGPRPTSEKFIQYCREDKKFAAFLFGNYVGSFLGYSEAETELDARMYKLSAVGLGRAA